MENTEGSEIGNNEVHGCDVTEPLLSENVVKVGIKQTKALVINNRFFLIVLLVLKLWHIFLS